MESDLRLFAGFLFIISSLLLGLLWQVVHVSRLLTGAVSRLEAVADVLAAAAPAAQNSASAAHAAAARATVAAVVVADLVGDTERGIANDAEAYHKQAAHDAA